MSGLSRTALFLSFSLIFSRFGAVAFAKTQVGRAVYYSDKMDGVGVSLKGDKYDKTALTAATHRGFPLGSMVRVTNLSNHKTVTVKVTDRMNPKSKAVVDLSRKAAEALDMIQRGHARVRMETVQAK